VKVSLKWLQDYINVSEYLVSPGPLVERLTAAGLEVEAVENLSQKYDSVVVGEILEKASHPNAQKLSVCQVATGQGVLHQIVCGAQNHRAGDRVVVALPGAVLPGGLAIQATEIRGVASAGMLCSAKELGLEDRFGAQDGIVILERSARIGQTLAEHSGLDDVILTIKVTPNRADCLSHFGLARELSALLALPVQFKLPPARPSRPAMPSDRVDVRLDEPALCPRYCAQLIAGVEITESPSWLKQRLESVGLKSINNVVDATNFVMMEMGQPLHAFDAARLAGRSVSVGRARAGERLKTLDGTELVFEGDELVIRDESGPVALAGAIGGLDSGVQSDTKAILLESAYFAASAVRRTARRLGVETDSAYRFSRGVNIEAVPLALRRCAEMIQRLAGGEAVGDEIDLYPQVLERPLISLSKSFVESRLGFEVDWELVCQTMRLIGCEVSEAQSDRAKFRPPLFRVDITVDVDLVEEFARLIGYDKLRDALPGTSVAPLAEDPFTVDERRARRWLSRDAQQAMNFAFVHSKHHDQVLGDRDNWAGVGLRLESEPVRLINPLNEELDIMRQSLLPGLVRNVAYNTRNGNPTGRLFETGFAHFKTSEMVEARYQQRSRIGWAFWGAFDGLWAKHDAVPLVYSLKLTVEDWLRSLGLDVRFEGPPGDGEGCPDTFHPRQMMIVLVDGKRVGALGSLHPSLQEIEKIRGQVAVGEIDFDAVRQVVARRGLKRYRGISRWPKVERDLAFVMPKAMDAQVLVDRVKASAGDLLTAVDVFDVYVGPPLQTEEKSLAIRLVYQAADRTLEDRDVADSVQRVLGQVKADLGIGLRA
jgi:phenylalanyl-tRNA synthetase beta chain